MKTAAIITTAIATIIFLITSYLLTYDPIGRSTKDGMFIIQLCYLVYHPWNFVGNLFNKK